MAKAFVKRFEFFEVSRNRSPDLILVSKTITKTLKKLSENPIYYGELIQFLGGQFYRAAIGFEKFWDNVLDQKLTNQLDSYLTHLSSKGRYNFETFKVQAYSETSYIWGLPWVNGVRPETLDFKLKCKCFVKHGETLLARVSRLKGHYYVDFERGNGEVFSVNFQRYRVLMRCGFLKRQLREDQKLKGWRKVGLKAHKKQFKDWNEPMKDRDVEGDRDAGK